MPRNRTYREVDGERIEGTWRPVFLRSGNAYLLADLIIYADGAIRCWDWVDLDGLRDLLRSGRVATTLEPDARASAHHLAAWRFGDPIMAVTAEGLLGEVADEIDRLNDRPDSTARCLHAAERYVATRAEVDRVALRAAYEAIPVHLRRYALGDMDNKDWPLRVLATPAGERLTTGHTGATGPEMVTGGMRRRAYAYFTDRFAALERMAGPDGSPRGRPHPDDPPGGAAPTLTLNESVFPHGWPDEPGTLVLRNEYPAPVTVSAATYPTLVHAYWALSTPDAGARDRIRAAGGPYEVRAIAADAPRRGDWPAVRLAVMTGLLRAKFDQHPRLADVLVGTGDARIHYSGSGSHYWHAYGQDGRNWIGRALELVRAELVARRAGITPSGPA